MATTYHDMTTLSALADITAAMEFPGRHNGQDGKASLAQVIALAWPLVGQQQWFIDLVAKDESQDLLIIDETSRNDAQDLLISQHGFSITDHGLRIIDLESMCQSFILNYQGTGLTPGRSFAHEGWESVYWLSFDTSGKIIFAITDTQNRGFVVDILASPPTYQLLQCFELTGLGENLTRLYGGGPLDTQGVYYWAVVGARRI